MADRLRVVTWNLWWRFGDWQRRQQAITAALADEQPDLVGLQEVWTHGAEDQAQTLARHLGMHWVLAPSPAPRRWQDRLGAPTVGVANAVLSRWPITSHDVVVLPAPDGGAAEHTLLLTRIDSPNGPVSFATTHLYSAPGGSAVRCRQVAVIARALAEWAGCEHPPILTGDLNAEPDSDEVRLIGGHKTAPAASGLVLLDAWAHADARSGSTRDQGWTWDTRNPHVTEQSPISARIDYVLVGLPPPGGRGRVDGVRLVGDRPVDGVWPSDHAGVLADLRQQEPVTARATTSREQP